MSRKKIISSNAYLTYLICILFWITILPLLEFTGVVPYFEFAMINILLFASYYILSRTRLNIASTLLIAFSFVVLNLSFFIDIHWLTDIARILLFVLFGFITLHFFHRIRNIREVDEELLTISISAYVMLGIMGAILCYITTVIYPDAFNVSFDREAPILDFTYYSFVSLTTLGYGDILPQIPASKALAILISLSGQLYLAIVIAMIVGKYISRKAE